SSTTSKSTTSVTTSTVSSTTATSSTASSTKSKSTTLAASKGATLVSTAPQTMLTEPPLRDVLISTILPSLTVAPVPKLEAQNWWYWWCWWYPSSTVCFWDGFKVDMG
ncbi:unnamed protein product, partial [Brugia timori]|uniref:REJ domain-containing protein n=1 Tax=Brugia timori TaxID=42155 RepID=A0A0R3QY68_9BILA